MKDLHIIPFTYLQKEKTRGQISRTMIPWIEHVSLMVISSF